MKRVLIFLCISMVLPGSYLQAQSVLNTSADLDINLIKAAHMVHGDMWYDFSTGQPALEYPKGTEKHAGYASGLWMGGYDPSGILKGATSLYRTLGLDYYPGPLDATGTCDSATSYAWSRIWKVNISDITTFLALSTKTIGTIPPVILEWPAKGNLYAKGKDGISLSISGDMAPFVDVNTDGVYNALDGDYPKIKGDQMLWWVLNDYTGIHTLGKTAPLKMQIHISAYAYSRSSAVDRMLFYEMEAHNKGTDLNGFVMGLWSDSDLGNPYDDALAVDSGDRRMVIAFNPGMDGTGGKGTYGNNPPLAALTVVEAPGDNYPSVIQHAKFTSFEGTPSGHLRDPRSMDVFYNYMTGRDADGNLFQYKYGPYNCYFHDASSSICDSLKSPLSDRRYVIGTKAQDGFLAGTSRKMGFVFVVTDTNNHICPNLKMGEINDMVDTAWKVYYNPLPLSSKTLAKSTLQLKVYPNPAETMLYITTGTIQKDESMRVINALGQTIVLPVQRDNTQFTIDVQSLASGMYAIVYSDGMNTGTQTFIRK